LITEISEARPGKKNLRAAAAAAWQHLSQLAAPAGPRTSIQYRPLRSKSHTISGFLMMRALARMRFLRLKSWRYAEEFALTSRWFDAVTSAARIDYRFGVRGGRMRRSREGL